MHAPSSAGDGRHLRSIPPARLALIDRIARIRLPRGPHPAAARMSAKFLRTYYRGVGEEDLAARAPAALAHAARCHLELGRRRSVGQSLVRVFNPALERDGFESPHTVVQIVTDDRPFLIDSLGLTFNRAGLAVHVIVHPVLEVRRDGRGRISGFGADGVRAQRAESWEMYEVDRRTDAETLERLRRDIERTLAEVRAAVDDWDPMRERVRAIIAELENNPPPLASEEIGEALQLLQWMEERNFVFLGYRQYRLERGARQDSLRSEPRSGLGILRAHGRGERPSVTALKGEIRERARERELLVLTKANSISTIHRSEYLDYVGVKTFDARGEVSGEHRFLGLWTSTAYHRSPRDIPVLRLKVARVIEYFGLDPQSHDGKAVLNVLETYPRDELFQANTRDLVRICRGVVNLYERRTVRLLTRRDPYHRFFSCLVYVPRDRYNTDVRQRIERIVLEGFGGRSVESQVQISTASHARLHVVVRTEPGEHHKIDLAAIERQISDATLSWSDHLHEVLIERRGEAEGLTLANRYRHVFPMAYEEDVPPAEALADIADLEQVRAAPLVRRVSLHRAAGQAATGVHLKIVKLGETVSISDLLPMLENFGLRVIAERPYEIAWPEGGVAWIQDFELEHRDGYAIDLPRVAERFKEALAAGWDGAAENDGFNRLLFAAGLAAREILVLRAYCRYLLQTGVPFSQAYMERTLAANPAIAAALVRLFEARFDPQRPHGTRSADRAAEQIVARIRTGLDRVSSLDEDRILRAYLTLVQATMRTNYYRRGVAGAPLDYLSFKFNPAAIPDLPLPRPKYEIFVYSPRVEGVHLRMGDVARGGIRWSDRREDFRTEILGLMKAQHVKNTLIVPVGAKGGFVPKCLPLGNREEVQAEVTACYRTFIKGLLDLTDNIVAGRIEPPPRVVRRDGDDPYLVVAADKGTATFSDTANAIAAQYGFWLGDAFASGGSAGYDHKGLGITARGAWECVKRHFRELGVDIQKEDFTVVGIGDMSGDVFGNGMLLSRHILLQAAFDHRHIFLDPKPDAAASFAERQRLFALPRSSWDDFDRKCISAGGGVFPRTAKSIALSPQARAMLGLQSASATPLEVIRAILALPVDLLWNGGIGTYVKSSRETNTEVGDRTNDALRLNGNEVRAKVVGEGGNLGFTQRGRIEYARGGGRLNTDFIDNSAGVNTSDVEVNLKILLNPLVHSGKLTLAERNRLLARMSEEVCTLVLRNNYLQSEAISTLEQQAKARLSEYQHLIRLLERSGGLNRALEFLPSDEEIGERRKSGAGLTRPELSILLSYSKIWLNNHLLDSDVPEDPYLSSELERYFPGPVRTRFARAIERHRLRREIIATATTNSLINRMGPTFVLRAQEDTGAGPAQIARAFTAAREIFQVRDLWEDIETLDNRAPAKIQYAAAFETSRLLRHATYWLLARRPALKVAAAVNEFRAGVHEIGARITQLLCGSWREHFEAGHEQLVKEGLPGALAGRVASLEAHNASLDIVEIATAHDTAVAEAARVYFEVGAGMGLDWLRRQIDQLLVDGPWQATARTGVRDAAMRIHRALAERVLEGSRRGTAAERVAAWQQAEGRKLAHWQRTLAEMRAAGAADFATLTVGVEALRKLSE
jgi:glutamate dehydrogenase